MFSDSASQVSKDDLFYYRQRHKNRVYSCVVSLFSQLVETKGLTKRELAYRLDKEPAQITRWLSGPGNWTLDTVSDLLLAMGSELDCEAASVSQTTAVSSMHPLVGSDNVCKIIQFRPDVRSMRVESGTTAINTSMVRHG